MDIAATLVAAPRGGVPRGGRGRRTAPLGRALLASVLALGPSVAARAADDPAAQPPAAATPPAAAQPPAAAPQPAARAADSPAAAATPPAARERMPDGAAIRLLGRDVKGPSGEVVAQIVNVLVDEAGRPVAAVLDYGGFMGVGSRRIAVVWRALRFAPGETPEGTITVGLTRDQLKDFPEAKRGEPVVAAAPAPPAPASAAPAAGEPR